MIGIGTDLVELDRFRLALTRTPGLRRRLFTDAERAYAELRRDPTERFAARFAAKEAVLKAFGTGMGQRMRWTDVEIVNDVLGRPRVHLHGEVARYAERKGLADLDVSLSHAEGWAIAQAVAVWNESGGGCALSLD